MSPEYDGYDARRDRCMLDQSSSVAPPMHEIVGAPAALARHYLDLPDVADLVREISALAGVADPDKQAAGREPLAARAAELQAKYLAQGRGELSMLLGFAVECLRGGYPLRPLNALPTLNVGR